MFCILHCCFDRRMWRVPQAQPSPPQSSPPRTACPIGRRVPLITMQVLITLDLICVNLTYLLERNQKIIEFNTYFSSNELIFYQFVSFQRIYKTQIGLLTIGNRVVLSRKNSTLHFNPIPLNQEKKKGFQDGTCLKKMSVMYQIPKSHS